MVLKEKLLVADIGGTNARFALAECDGQRVRLVVKKAMEADDHSSVASAARSFLDEVQSSPSRAIFAVAAPVTGDDIAFTNSPWRFSQRELARDLRLTSLTVVNDFVAMARGAVAAQGSDLASIKRGLAAVDAPVVVLGPGTGLGLGIVAKFDGSLHVLATQGGFAALAPQDDREVEVFRALRRECSFVSFEHILSGRGLMNLYRVLSAAAGRPLEKQPEAITAGAISGADATARAAVEMFCGILGTFAGDAALMAGARGGVILAGGILPRIETLLRASRFSERFVNRDAMTEYMRSIPVSLLRSEEAALVGAALHFRASSAREN